MIARRFTEKPELNPAAVMSLHETHAAMRENRTLFPTTVVTVTAEEPDRLLVSGKNNRKIGERVEKGRFKGYSIFCLSLEERATCPADCELRGACFQTKAMKEQRRSNARRRRERSSIRHAVWIVRRMAVSQEERDWRVRLLTGPDDRDLTGKMLGDPRYERSALFAKRRGWL